MQPKPFCYGYRLMKLRELWHARSPHPGLYSQLDLTARLRFWWYEVIHEIAFMEPQKIISIKEVYIYIYCIILR